MLSSSLIIILAIFLCPAYAKIVIGVIVLLFLVFLIRGVFCIELNYFMTSMNRSPIKKCILTFDDGPGKYSLEVLGILKKHQIGGVFFMIGEKIEQHPSIKESIQKEGHIIGNHSYSHSNSLALMSSKKLIEEIQKTELLIGTTSNKIFRTPVGISNPNIARALKKTKHKNIGWSLRSYDTIATNTDQLVKRMLSKLQNNSIILLHDSLPKCADTLELFITKAKLQGVEFTSTDDLKTIFNA